MDHLTRLTATTIHRLTTPSTLLAALAAATATLSTLLWCIRDYRAFLALGPGGVPYNPLGWAAITLLVRPFALSAAGARRADAAWKDDAPPHEEIAALPRRRGDRAAVGGVVPHRQLSQWAGEGMRASIHNLFANAAAQNGGLLETKTSVYERHNDALFVAGGRMREPGAAALPRAAVVSGGEIGHPHADLSIHLYAAPADARVLIEKGWAERHRVAVPDGWWAKKLPLFNRVGDTFLMVYGPRDEEEMGVLQTILANSIRFMAGKDDIVVPEWKVRVGKA